MTIGKLSIIASVIPVIKFVAPDHLLQRRLQLFRLLLHILLLHESIPVHAYIVYVQVIHLIYIVRRILVTLHLKDNQNNIPRFPEQVLQLRYPHQFSNGLFVNSSCASSKVKIKKDLSPRHLNVNGEKRSSRYHPYFYIINRRYCGDLHFLFLYVLRLLYRNCILHQLQDSLHLVI